MRRARPFLRGAIWAGRRRVAILRAGADVLEQRKWDVSVACLIEVGKSRLEAVGEVEEAIDLIRHYCAEMERTDGFREERPGASSAERCSVVLRPYGVFGVIAPFNFPVALSLGMISAALVAGNTVVFKPSDAAGLTGRLVVEALVAGGLPDGVLNLVQGGRETGEALAQHPRVDGFAFTGSNAVGMTILRNAAASPAMRPVLAEMGGKNPAFVTASADLAVAAYGRCALGLRPVRPEMQRAVESLCRARRVRRVRRCARSKRPASSSSAIRAGRRFHGAGDRRGRARPLQGSGQRCRERRLGRPRRQATCRRRCSTAGRMSSRPSSSGLPNDHRINRDELFLPFLSLLAVRRPRRGDRRRQSQRLRPDRGHLYAGPGRARPLPRPRSRPACSMPTGRAARRPARGPASRRSAAGRVRGRQARAGSAAGTSRSSCANKATQCSDRCEQALRFAPGRARRAAARRHDHHVGRVRPGRQSRKPDPGNHGLGRERPDGHFQQCRGRRFRAVAPAAIPPDPQNDLVLRRREQAVRGAVSVRRTRA